MTIKNHTIDVLRHGSYTELILRDGIFYTPAHLFDKGMMACNVCGTLMPIDKKYCPQCKEWVICIHEDYISKSESKKEIEQNRIFCIPVPNKDEKKDAFISRFMTNQDMQLKYPIGWTRFRKAKEIFSDGNRFKIR